MLKKVSLVTVVPIIVSCSVLPEGPKYKLSDSDAKQLVIEINKFDQCLFADRYKAKDSYRSEEEVFLGRTYFSEILSTIIGQNNVIIIQNDVLSQKYATEQFNKFNNNRPVSFNKEWCEELKVKYKILKTKLHKEKEQISKRQQKVIKEQKEFAEQEEKARKARQAYYASPEGQRDLARQQYQQQLMAQQQMYQEQLRQQRQAYEFQQMSNMINGAINNDPIPNSV